MTLRIRWLVGMMVPVVALVLIPGCATSAVTGSQTLQGDKVQQIIKGTTTRAQVEQMFGPPDSVMLLDGGNRQLVYQGMKTHSDMSGQIAQMAVPFAALVPVHTKGTVRKQQLLVYVNADGIVKDYEYTDATSNSDVTSSAFGAHMTETTTVPSK